MTFFTPVGLEEEEKTERKGKQMRKQMGKLTDIKGIDAELARRLKDIGIQSPLGLLREGANGGGRLRISLRAGIEKRRVGSLVAQADLMRIKGVGREYAQLLEASGVGSVRELSQCDPTDLSDALLEANLLQRRVEVVPSEKRVAGWKRQAQGLVMGH